MSKSKLCWADRLAIFLLILFAIFGWVAEGGWNLDYAGFTNWLKLEFTLIGLLWILLRLMDWLTGGPERRLRRGLWLR